MEMPFMYRLLTSPAGEPASVWVVLIGRWSYSYRDTAWMSHDLIGVQALSPDIDGVTKEVWFSSEAEALEFIKNWWKENN